MSKKYGRTKPRQHIYSGKYDPDEDELVYYSSEERVQDRSHNKGEKILKAEKKKTNLLSNHDYDYLKRYGRSKRITKYDEEYLGNDFTTQNKDSSTQYPEYGSKLVREGNSYKTSRSNKLESFDNERKRGLRNESYLKSKFGEKGSFYGNIGDCKSVKREDSCVNRRGKSRSKRDEKTDQRFLYRNPSLTSSLDEVERGCHNCNNRSCDEKLVNSIIEKLKYDFNITPKDNINKQGSSLSKSISKDTKGVYVFVPTLHDDPKLSKRLDKMYKSVLFDEPKHVIDKEERVMGLRKLLNRYSHQNPKPVHCKKVEAGKPFCKSNLTSKVEKILNSVVRLSPNESNNRFLKKFESHLKNVCDKYGGTTHCCKYDKRFGYDESDPRYENEMFEYYAEKIASLLI